MKYLALGCSHGKIPKIKNKDFGSILYLGDSTGYAESRRLVNKWLKKKFKEGLEEGFEIFISKKLYNQLQKKERQNARKITEYLNSLNKETYIIPGNWDYYKDRFNNFKKNYYKEEIISNLKNIKDSHLKLIVNNEHVIIGYGISSNSEDKKEYNYYIKRLRKLFKEARRKNKPIIFITHNQAYRTKFSRIKDKNNPFNGFDVGSKVVKDLIKEFSPLLCISAHMHEHFGKIKVGKTTCVAVGYGMKGNKVLVDVDRRINSIKFIKR